jgi:hypothetical protein
VLATASGNVTIEAADVFPVASTGSHNRT